MPSEPEAGNERKTVINWRYWFLLTINVEIGQRISPLWRLHFTRYIDSVKPSGVTKSSLGLGIGFDKISTLL